MASTGTRLATLDERQRIAAQHVHGPLAVIAGAGTGKTRVLVARVAWLIAAGHAEPGEICALTFMNDSAREIAERLERALGTKVACQITVGTTHRLANTLLRGYAGRFARPGRYSIWNSDQARRALTQALAASADETRQRLRSASWPPAPRSASTHPGRPPATRPTMTAQPRGRGSWPTSTPSAPPRPSISTISSSTPPWPSSPI